MGKLPPNILKNATEQKYSDGGGLYLYSKGLGDDGRARGSWVYRYTYLKKRWDLGLGSVEAVSLKDARAARDRWAAWMKATGGKPHDEIERLEREQQSKLNTKTLADIAPEAFESIKATLKDGGQAGRWESPVKLYILPALGHMDVEAISQADIHKALSPIWHSKHPTAKKALNRLSTIMKYAAASGLSVDLNAIPNAKVRLGAVTHKPVPHPALPVAEAARLYQSLDPENTVQRALMLYLLLGGGVRLKPVRMAHISEFEGDVWTVPGEKMKGKEGKTDDFRVPLTDEMKALVSRSVDDCRGGYLFSSKRDGEPASGKRVPVISDQALENIMRECEKRWKWSEPYRPHGVRACFRSWVSEVYPNSYAVAETALAHSIGSIVERSYSRSDFLDQRLELLRAWGRIIQGEDESSDVIHLSPFRRNG
ncbi:tyrosine-type recombinase/integrase [Rhodobacteraceae bacterium MYP1-1]|uniref:Tyrosine-type recombinase/integrase n=2 Tax=Halocynthiibacter styelae TaxID=2761955 RepID=A0A8J7IFC6_9RHOB|nr:tyrosine-type recombinase/integrase [Paenihalocynthiibacter styelae]